MTSGEATAAALDQREAGDAPIEVAILGGGLAGLSLALQLKRADSAIDVQVFERRTGPAPDAAFKIGESTVEIGAHYFAEVLGLRDHLDAAQIKKFGFRFFFSDGQAALDRCTEIGTKSVLATPAWQLDRGRFENHLAAEVRALGVPIHEGSRIKRLEPASGGPHQFTVERASAEHSHRCRWLIDAAGRAGLMRRKLDLNEANGHRASSAWFRVKGHIKIDDWSSDPDWTTRCKPPERWRSTNHLLGHGYWVWLIPLVSGSHSIGIVADEDIHPVATYNSLERAMAWLGEHQPQLAAALADDDHEVQDFAFFRNFSYGCKQLFSADRWALTGEAGFFLDPFYSPGSDFIAIGNGYITDLIVRDRAGERIAGRVAVYDELMRSFYRSTLTLYERQYPLFGRADILPVKIIWDYAFYWGVLAPLYFGDGLTDLSLLARLKAPLAEAQRLNLAVQALFTAWSETEAPAFANDSAMLDQCDLDWFAQMNRALSDTVDAVELESRVRAHVERLGVLAHEIATEAERQHPGLAKTLLTSVTTQSAEGVPLLDASWFGPAATESGSRTMLQ